jgi:Bacterial RNA polymerase, alpha chain C terminal domain
MRTYSDFFKTLHDETGPTGHLGRGTHYSVLRAIVFHDPLGKALPEGQFADFAVIWDEDHDERVMVPIEEFYRRGILSSFLVFGERKGAFTAILSNKISSAIDAIPFNPAFLYKVDELNLSLHSANALRNADIVYIGDLVQMTDLEILCGTTIGNKSLGEIKRALVQRGLHLATEIPDWLPENIQKFTALRARTEFLEEEIGSICQLLDDPWISTAVTLGSADNPIIQDENEKVGLYLKNLEMLWKLGLEPWKLLKDD